MKNLYIGKNVRNLALRYLMIVVFMFMCIPIVSMNSPVFGPILGVFYFAALIYYFWFTMRVEGGLDVNRVKIGQAPRFRWKGAVCALILAIPLMIISIVPLTFHNPVPAEYRAYFTGNPTVLTADSQFNQDLKRVSGKNGYISEITFTEDGDITKIVYEEADGLTVVSLGVSNRSTAKEIAEANYIDYTEGENTTRYFFPSNYSELSAEDRTKVDEKHPEAVRAAFKESMEGLRKVKTDVVNANPLAGWQNIWNMVKGVSMFCLSEFCAIFSRDNAVLTCVVYCICLLVLTVAAQVGYEMGYHNVEIIRKKQPVRDGKAGDSVVIQRGGRKEE